MANDQVAELTAENKALFEQLHLVQEELERLHNESRQSDVPGASLKLQWVDDELPGILAENQRLQLVIDTQKRMLEAESNSLAGRLGRILVQHMRSPGSLVTLPGKLWKFWREVHQKNPPRALGGKMFSAVITTCEQSGMEAVGALLDTVDISSVMRANAYTALARHLMQHDAVMAAEAAQRAFETDPRPYRFKWLIFRLYDAGAVCEAEAMLDLLPLDISFSASEARQAERVRLEAKQIREGRAYQQGDYELRKKNMEKYVHELIQARDQANSLVNERAAEIERLLTGRAELERQKEEMEEKYHTQLLLVDEQKNEIERLLAGRTELERNIAKLEEEYLEQLLLADKREDEIELLLIEQAEFTRRRGELEDEYRAQLTMTTAREEEIESLLIEKADLMRRMSKLEDEYHAQLLVTAERDNEIELLLIEKTEFTHRRDELEEGYRAQLSLANKRGAEIERLLAGQAELERYKSELHALYREQMSQAWERGAEIERLLAERAELERHKTELHGQYNEQLTLARERVAELERILARQKEIELHNKELTDQYREQVVLANKCQADLQQSIQGQLALEQEKRSQFRRIDELELQVADLARERDRQAHLVDDKLCTLSSTLEENKKVFENLLGKQSNDLIKIRNFLDGCIKQESSGIIKQIEATLVLQQYFTTGKLLGVSLEQNTWPVAPDFALYIVERIEQLCPDIIIEFGSGISTTIVARTLDCMKQSYPDRPVPQFISFEHLEQYYLHTKSNLTLMGLDEYVRLILAPLQDYVAPNGLTYPYYACQESIGALVPCAKDKIQVLVIVDGPPSSTGIHARYPAFPVITRKFSDANIEFLLDDYIRSDEGEIVGLWRSECAAMGIPCHITEKKLMKGACVLRIAPTNAGGVV